MTTKERILEESLTLFAQNGFDGTSVEQIAERVGIKAPSLYKHYKGKEDILNAIIDAAETRYEEYFGSDRNFGKLPDNKEEFIQMAMYHSRPDDRKDTKISRSGAIPKRTSCRDHDKASVGRHTANVYEDYRRYDESRKVQK